MVVLPAPDGPTSATSAPGRATKLTSASTCWDGAWSSFATDSSEASETSCCARIAEVDVLELDLGRPAMDLDGIRFLGDHGRKVEHLEDPVEGHERGHDADLHVRERRERAIEAAEVRTERDQRSDLQRSRCREQAAEAVHERGGERRRQQQRGHEDGVVHRLQHADVPNAARLLLELADLALRLPEQLDQQRSGDVEALAHHRDHGRVQVVALAGDRLDALAHPAGRQDEDGKDHERQERDLPAQHEHRDERDGHADQIADDG